MTNMEDEPCPVCGHDDCLCGYSDEGDEEE